MRKKIIANGVKNLKEYGYPDCNEENILTDDIYKDFFISMLKDNLGVHSEIDKVINGLLKECET